MTSRRSTSRASATDTFAAATAQGRRPDRDAGDDRRRDRGAQRRGGARPGEGRSRQHSQWPPAGGDRRDRSDASRRRQVQQDDAQRTLEPPQGPQQPRLHLAGRSRPGPDRLRRRRVAHAPNSRPISRSPSCPRAPRRSPPPATRSNRRRPRSTTRAGGSTSAQLVAPVGGPRLRHHPPRRRRRRPVGAGRLVPARRRGQAEALRAGDRALALALGQDAQRALRRLPDGPDAPPSPTSRASPSSPRRSSIRSRAARSSSIWSRRGRQRQAAAPAARADRRCRALPDEREAMSAIDVTGPDQALRRPHRRRPRLADASPRARSSASSAPTARARRRPSA